MTPLYLAEHFNQRQLRLLQLKIASDELSVLNDIY